MNVKIGEWVGKIGKLERRVFNSKENSKPMVTIMMPLYNVEDFLEESLESALNQNYKGPYEIIAVNDGSQDGTSEILRKYKSLYGNKLKVIHQENQGAGAARNTALDNSKGKYIINLDGDDRLKPEAIKEIVDCFEKNSNINFIYSDHNEISEKGEFIQKREKDKLHKYFNDLIFHTFFPVHVQAYRAAALGGNRYDTSLKMAEDYDFALRIMLPSNPAYGVGHLSKALYDYRLNEKGITQTDGKKRISSDTQKVVKNYLRTNEVYGKEGRYLSVSPGKEASFLMEHKLKGSEIEINVKAKEALMEFVGQESR